MALVIVLCAVLAAVLVLRARVAQAVERAAEQGGEPALTPKEARLLAKDEARRLKYYSASQWTLVWWRFRRHRAAMAGAIVLGLMFLGGLFAEFVAPYGPTTRDTAYLDGAPQIPMFCDQNGCSWRPFIHGVKTERDPITLRAIAVSDPETRLYVRFFVDGEPVKLMGLIPITTHLFGVEGGMLHLWGTDSIGRDVFSRTLYATWTSLSIGILGVLISFVLALVIGGIAGYFGGVIDMVIQRVTEVVRVIPIIPLYMGLAAAMPREWSTIQVYFAMTVILGLFGWPTLARRVRSQLLSIRDEDYVVAARLAGARPRSIIARHMLPSFTSFIIVDLVISFPYMILSETALSFVGLGLRPPAVSWGVLLQEAQSIRVLEQTPWLLIPALFVVVAVLAFTVIGDGLRDAADPYASSR
ncbi:MAG: ABC transporter permease [Devosia sp.]